MIFLYLLYYTVSVIFSFFFKSWRQIRLRLPAPTVVTSVPIYIFIRHYSLVLMGASFQIVKGNILGLVVAETKVWLVPVSDKKRVVQRRNRWSRNFLRSGAGGETIF